MIMFTGPGPEAAADLADDPSGWPDRHRPLLLRALEMLTLDEAYERLVAVLTVSHDDLDMTPSFRVVQVGLARDRRGAIVETEFGYPAVAHARWGITYWAPMRAWSAEWLSMVSSPPDRSLVPRVVQVVKPFPGFAQGSLLVWDPARRGYVPACAFGDPGAMYVPLDLLGYLSVDVMGACGLPVRQEHPEDEDPGAGAGA